MSPSPTLQELIDSVLADAGAADPLAQLAEASRMAGDLAEVTDSLLGHFVDQCRRSGRSWTEISGALGVTKQAAHKRFSASPPTFERFTPRARAVLVRAQAEAVVLGHTWVGTEHLLLALLEPSEAVAAQVLASQAVTRERCEIEIRSRIAPVPDSAAPEPGSRLPFTPRAADVLRAALELALELGHNYIGTEHLLLGLYRDEDTVAAQTLVALGAPYDDTRARVLGRLQDITGGRAASPGPAAMP